MEDRSRGESPQRLDSSMYINKNLTVLKKVRDNETFLRCRTSSIKVMGSNGIIYKARGYSIRAHEKDVRARLVWVGTVSIDVSSVGVPFLAIN